jgi:hypothetical protein
MGVTPDGVKVGPASGPMRIEVGHRSLPRVCSHCEASEDGEVYSIIMQRTMFQVCKRCASRLRVLLGLIQ